MKEEREISGMVDQVKMNHYKAPLVVAHDFCPNSKKKKELFTFIFCLSMTMGDQNHYSTLSFQNK